MRVKPSYQQLEKQIEQLTKGSEQKLRQLIKNSFDMIVLIDSNGIQHYVSESCEKTLGYRPEELIHIPVIEQMIHPDDQQSAKTGLTDIIENSKNGGVQYRHRHKNGGWVYLEAFGTNQINNPYVQSIVLNVRDITERKNAEKALQKSKLRLSELNATKDRFFSIIGHDLKNPFNSIIGFSDLLVEEIQNKNYEELENYAKIIHDSSKRALDLLSNLLDWAQAQSGKIQFQPNKIDAALLIHEVTELLNDSAKQKSITISINTPPSLPAFGDRLMINTILRNLISNSIKFTHPDGKITISTEQNENELIVSVTDNGVGIKKENIAYLFRIEKNYSTLGTHNEKGTGLGLLLCKEFIEMHGGRIWVDCMEHNGCTFKFTLPIQQQFT
ncbi:MAG: ATP-binding protein [Prolixibacteraceae bacterium]